MDFSYLIALSKASFSAMSNLASTLSASSNSSTKNGVWTKICPSSAFSVNSKKVAAPSSHFSVIHAKGALPLPFGKAVGLWAGIMLIRFIKQIIFD